MQTSNYQTTSLKPYIDKYGWENIRHIVLVDDLSKNQAIKLEGLLIEEATRQGFCINKNGSGYIYRDKMKEYRREYYREYRKRTEWKKYKHDYGQKPENKERQREYMRKYNEKKKALK